MSRDSEKQVMGGGAGGRVQLRLFVAGTSARSLRTIESLRRLCEERLRDGYDLEVIDIYQQPELADRDGVVAAPTLVRLAPGPLRRITGDLLDEDRILRALGVSSEISHGH